MPSKAFIEGLCPVLLGPESCLSEEDRKMLSDMYEAEGDAAWEPVAGDDPLDERRIKRVSYTYQELREQPDKIAETIREEREAIREAARQVFSRKINQIYMVGCGDSVAALRGSKYLMQHLLRIPCQVLDALDFCYFEKDVVDENTLVICLSSSGRTIRVVESLLVARSKGAQTLALTNTVGSPLWNYASSKIRIHAERKGWPTQSSTSSMAMVQQFALDLAELLGTCEDHDKLQADFDSIPERMRKVTNEVEPQIRKFANELVDSNIILFAGGGPLYTCAEYGCAKVKESTPNYSMSIELEEYHHYNSQHEGDTLFLFAPDGPTQYRALETIYASKALKGKVIAVTSRGAKQIIEQADEAVVIDTFSEFFDNYLMSVPVQMFGYFLSVEMVHKAGGEVPQIG
ncbi:MAG: SIS domain-containing protein [Oscillospiraceae bacterium]|nr:SIS domain-containing protein [Oscillospiraceae bacterium]